ncbi:MAG TPA: SLC13 family permease [Flavobacteriales bacterium]|jgi:sodium-dependent dicarboxylate transporter 2/3/5|nr:SLC13/DASS family transporter [Flavobacteriales bacterium]MBK6551931.1 SLC13/DASS family transporter [Flavobacteriales bacterium]MBK8531143.1 SLC13/DASS family transporter [Flavobacteriales bacterium]MBK9627389.1 SLC13/DASS family transporter [Flavobacteriales bacterium]MBP8878669.1 SLC13/DASS family transporter [Flavobacteriales bacterium]
MRTHLLRLSGPVLGLVVYALLRYLGHAPAAMAGVVTWMAVWWISEAVPLAVTSLLPLVLFPLLGIDTMGGTATNYGKEIIFLFLGGFLLALALERAQLHRRIALRIIGRIGGTGPRLIAGMMVTSALLSMWMNSTSCVLVMLPIALSLLDGDGDPALRKRLTVPLLLAVSYGATIGGMATPVGTPPNLVLLEVWRDRWPDRPPIGFGQWMSFGIPLMVIYLGIAWLLITRWVFKVPKDHISPPAEVKARLASLGKVTYAERVAAIVFATVAVLWVTGDDLTFGNGFALHGWRGRTGLTSFSDGAIAILGALMLFLIPIPQALDGDAESRPPHALLTWKYAEANVPWGILLLFGGGFAIASGIDRSGLAMEMVAGMERLKGLSPPLLIGAVSGVVCFLSELGSNTATASLTLPILAQSTEAWGIDPQALLIPATLAATLGFALPVASPMQAIVFGSGRIPVREMVRAGIWMDLIGLVLLVALLS